GEWYARRGLGLGDPPLYMLDDDIGYLPRPNSRVTRYGIVVEHNIFSMRCPNFDMEKTDPAQFRVLLLGDSIRHRRLHPAGRTCCIIDCRSTG
ncbi:MAG TPA: hypothetical protein PK400_09595, partial [Phycisphaerales bacterium]|nr:hypothetical protein [Phycisphaerales bacterium]